MKIKVLVVDDNELYIKTLINNFKNHECIDIIGYATCGDNAIKCIKSEVFDIMILDLVMPNGDGFEVLDYIKDNNIKKQIIMLTSFNEVEAIRRVSEYGVKAYILKPVSMERLEKQILNLSKNKKYEDKVVNFDENRLQQRVTVLLHNLGIPSHIKGYELVRTAIIMVYIDSSLIGGITKELYPNIAIKYDTSVQRVERSIRHAIEVAWLRGDIELMEQIFGHSVDIDRAKPTNSEFIVTIADKLKLDMIGV